MLFIVIHTSSVNVNFSVPTYKRGTHAHTFSQNSESTTFLSDL